MTRAIVMASIIGAAILLAAGAMIYFSPFQTCVRATAGTLEFGDHGPRYSLQDAQQVCAVRRISN